MAVLVLAALVGGACERGGTRQRPGATTESAFEAREQNNETKLTEGRTAALPAAPVPTQPADAAPLPDAQPGCWAVRPASSGAKIMDERLTEISGVVLSRRQPGVLWVHNDSGDAARIFALDRSGRTLGTFVLSGVQAVDWEDIALGTEDGREMLYLGDIGDNRRRRKQVVVYRVPEPVVPRLPGRLATVRLSEVAALPLQYPGGEAFDAETLLADPLTGELLVVTKDTDGRSRVFRVTPPFVPGEVRTLELVAQLQLSGMIPRATGGDILPTGRALALRTYTDIWLWPRSSGQAWSEALASPPLALASLLEGQGEAIGFESDGLGYLTVSEGLHSPLNFFELAAHCADGRSLR